MSNTTLPAVTLTDPWASLVVAGIKTIETRKGALLSGFSGPLVIHRSKAPSAVPRHDAQRPKDWPDDDAGCALGVVYVEETARLTMTGPGDMLPGMRTTGLPDWLCAPLADLRRRACFDDIEGRYLSRLTRATWFPAPVPARGMQCRFLISVPTEYLPEWAR